MSKDVVMVLFRLGLRLLSLSRPEVEITTKDKEISMGIDVMKVRDTVRGGMVVRTVSF